MSMLITNEELLQLNLQEIVTRHATNLTKKVCVKGGKICCEFSLNKEELEQDILKALKEYNINQGNNV